MHFCDHCSRWPLLENRIGWEENLACIDLYIYIYQKHIRKTLKSCCTSRVPNLFVLARRFRDFAYPHAQICVCMHEIQCTQAHEIIMPFITQKTQAKTLNIAFLLTQWPWPLTYDLDLRTCPRYYQGQSPYQISPWWGTSSEVEHSFIIREALGLIFGQVKKFPARPWLLGKLWEWLLGDNQQWVHS